MADHKTTNKIPDSSSFTITLPAVPESIMDAQKRIRDYVSDLHCNIRSLLELDIIVEETFINIASYAYNPDKGTATVRVEVSEEPVVVTITFVDHGIPYDPLAKEDPDVTLSAEEREIGGLGIFMTKKLMDDVVYEYKDGSNILRLIKRFK